MTLSGTNTFRQNRKVLYVDDEANLLSSFVSLLRKERVETSVLQDSQQIAAILAERGPFAVVFSDQRMPVVDGVSVLETVAKTHPETVRILITGYADYSDTVRAINLGGISQFIAKPWKDEELRKVVRDGITRYNLAGENAFLLGELKHANETLTELLDGTVTGAVNILRDMITYSHPAASSQVERVRKLGIKFLEMSPEIGELERWEIRQALNLFNLGIVLTPSWTTKPSRQHNAVAADLLKDIPRFKGVSDIILLQTKAFDGSGEPSHFARKENDLPLGARLLHILLDLDKALSERRSGRAALELMALQPGQYDGTLIEQMLGGPHASQLISQTLEESLSVHELRPGMMLLEDIMTQSGQLLLKAGFSLTETSVKILLQWHINDPITQHVRVRLQE